MAKNRLEDLRNHLFETLEKLKDEEEPMEVDRARAVADVANAIISSAKLELQFLELTGQTPDSSFLTAKPQQSLSVSTMGALPGGAEQEAQRKSAAGALPKAQTLEPNEEKR